MNIFDKINYSHEINKLHEHTKQFNFFTKLEDIGLIQGEETIEDIVNSLPSNSVLCFNLHANYGNKYIYPLSSGIITVIKSENNGRVSFKCENEYDLYVGYYNSYYSNPFIGWSYINKGIFTNSTEDINLIDQTCIRYCTASAQNLPESSASFYVITIVPKHLNGYKKQIALRATGSNNAFTKTFIREMVNGTWSSWRLDISAFQGSGSPEGIIAAPIGSFYINTDGGADTTLYIKTSGTGNTGWTAK